MRNDLEQQALAYHFKLRLKSSSTTSPWKIYTYLL
jgi:hypothetical protein